MLLPNILLNQTKRYFFFSIILFSYSFVFSQSDSPCGAPSLTVSTSCSYTSGTSVSATYSSNAANFGTPGCASPGAPDVWYSFTAPAGGQVTISTSDGTMTDSGMALYSSADCTTGTEIDCSDDDGPGSMSEITASGLTPGNTYYVRIWEYSSGTGTFDICVTEPTPPPANDECATATALTVNSGLTCTSETAGTVEGATASAQTIGACFGTADDDVWYSFVATNTTHYLDLNNVAGSTTDMYHTVYSGACGSLSAEIICNDSDNSTLSGLTVGVSYKVRVYTYTATTGQTSTFDVCITSPPPPPSNDECAGATALTVNAGLTCTSETAGTVEGATASAQGMGACFGTADDDVWYTFVATNTTHYLELNDVAGSTIDMYHSVYSGACGSLSAALICNDSDDSELNGLSIGVTYTVRVYTYTATVDQTSTFDVCVTSPIPPPANDECIGAYVVTANTGSSCTSMTAGTLEGATESVETIGACGGDADDDVWFTFVANDTDMSIGLNNIEGSTSDLYHIVYSGACASLSAEIICSDANGSSIAGLTVGVTYTIRVYSWSSFEQTSTFEVCVLPTPPAPTNVDCANMDPICSGTPIAFTAQANGTSAAAGPDYDCLVSQPNPSWYYMEIDMPGDLSIDITAGADIDFALWGPYANLPLAQAACLTYPTPIDCSFSTSATEQANVASVLNGEVYILLVTNYESVTQIINIDQASGATATTNCAIVPLPVGMSTYEVQLQNEWVNIDWTCESETNNAYFAVERSADGLLWETISIKKGKGTSLTTTSYRFQDEKPLEGISYYRIKQVDNDGAYTYTPIKSVNYRLEMDFVIYPLPAGDEVRIQAGKKKITELQLMDIRGTEIPVSYRFENQEYVLSITNCKKGVYSLVFWVDGVKMVKRIVKA